MKKMLKRLLGFENIENVAAQYEPLLKAANDEIKQLRKANDDLRQTISKRQKDRKEIEARLRVSVDQDEVITKLRAHIVGIKNVGAQLRREMLGFETLIGEFNSSLITRVRFKKTKKRRS